MNNKKDKEIELKRFISRYILVKERVHREDIIKAVQKQYKIGEHDINKILRMLEFIGIITEDKNCYYSYIAESEMRVNYAGHQY